jgi:hypothetical protein
VAQLVRFETAQPHGTFIGLLIHRLARQFRTVGQDDLVGSSMLGYQPLEYPHQSSAGQRGADLDSQRVSR